LLERGRLVFGLPRMSDPPPEGLRVEGSLGELDLRAWGDWWARLQRGAGEGGPRADPGRSLRPGSFDLDLAIGRLDLGAASLTDARLRTAPRPLGWTVDVESRELKGALSLPVPGSDSPAELRLERLDLASLLPPGDSGGPSSQGAPGERPLRLPAADLRVEDLRWDGKSLGRLSLDLRPEPSGLALRRIELDGPGDTRVAGDADWIDGPEGGRARLSLDLRSGDTGPLMRALEYRSVLSEAPLESRIRLDWPGGLGSFALARSTGTVDLEVGAGRLLEVEPGVGRVLGILNLGALSRRLALDFTDVYQQGFSFERIRGEIFVSGGRAELRRFEIEGPASAIRVSGFTDLRSRTFDQTVTVEPRIGSSVALASALAGGPVVGAAVYLADKVTGGTIDKLGAYRYRVTGPWADPELIRLGWDPFPGQSAPAPSNGETGRSGPAPPENHFLD
jgi:uncharacterized protein YhdP